MHKLCSFIILVLFLGCTSQEEQRSPRNQADLLDSLDVPEDIRQLDSLTVFDPNQTPEYNIRVEHDRTYGKMLMSGGIGMAIIDSLGQVYLADFGRSLIRVYNSDGTEKSEFGRKGRGPGEFVQIWKFLTHKGNPIVYDNVMSRIQVFSPETLEPIETFLIDRGEISKLDGVRSAIITGMESIGDSGFLIKVPLHAEEDERTRFGYYRMDSEGNVTSGKLFETLHIKYQDFAEGSKSIVSSDEGLVDVSMDNTIYTVNTSEILIQIKNMDGNTQRRIYYPYDNIPLDRNQLLEEYDSWLRSRMRDADFGDHWPALESMVVDDEKRIWLGTITANEDTSEWWVLAPDGNLLGKFSFPPDQSVVAIRNGYLYVEMEDREEGLYWVDRYDVIMEPYSTENQ